MRPRAPHHLPNPQGSTASAPSARTAAMVAASGWPSGICVRVPRANTSIRSALTIWRPAITSTGNVPGRIATTATGSAVGMICQTPAPSRPSARAAKQSTPALSVSIRQPRTSPSVGRRCRASEKLAAAASSNSLQRGRLVDVDVSVDQEGRRSDVRRTPMARHHRRFVFSGPRRLAGIDARTFGHRLFAPGPRCQGARARSTYAAPEASSEPAGGS